MEFRLLGRLEVTKEIGPVPLGGPRQRVVLAHLLLRMNRIVPVDRLIDEVWADEPPAAARNVLQTYVSRLRKTLGADRLEGRAGGYVLHADPSEVDLHRFTTLVDQARTRARNDPDAAVRLYREADGLWRGPALDDLADQPSLQGDIARLEELRAAATEGRIVLELGLGRDAELVAELETLTARHPLRERLWAHLMTALYRSGRKSDALAAYHRARRILAEEVGLEPSAELRQLEQDVLRQDPALEVAGVPLRGFRLLERVGEGSFGVVHRALQPQVGREVAVKVVRPELANNPEFIRRFEAEAQLVARLEHPHIVPLYDYWREPDGAFLVMRFLRGGNLRDAIRRGPLGLEQAVGVIEQVGAALTLAHRQGVVHRDVKPANVLFDEEGNAFLSDFGIATDLAPTRAGQAASTPGTVVHYLSPEKIRGEAPTSRSDVYSLGVVLFEMLAGRHPFDASSPEDVLRQHLLDSVPPLHTLRPGLPSGIDAVVRRATRTDPRSRYPDAAAFVSALAAAVEPTSRAVARPTGAVGNPYKGLRPFLEPDAVDFHGREGLVRRLVARLADGEPGERLLALVGPSGSGKSSAVRAGLIPAVRAGSVAGSERWYVAEMLPRDDPFGELRAALLRLAPAPPTPDVLDRLERDEQGLIEAVAWLLPDDDCELLLVIDQFEEVFTLVADEEPRARFLAALRATAANPRSRVRIVLTLRADFFDRPLAYSGLAQLVRAGTELVVPLTAEELERAISGPSERAGVGVEPGLVPLLVSDVIGRPGALPLLQYTLAELFDRRQDATLTLAAYHRIGGIAGAVAGRAEAIFDSLAPPRQEAVRQLFLRLVNASDDIDTRRRVLRSEVVSLAEDAGEMEAVVDAFADGRLLSFGRDPDTRAPTVEVAHEALLREWSRLRAWIDESREDLRTERRLATATDDWLTSGRDPSFLVGGTRLEEFETWRGRSGLALTPDERDFLAASVTARDRLHAEDAARQRRERELEHRSLRRLRSLVLVLGGAVVAAGGLTVFALQQREEADQERRVAIARELAAASVANLDLDAERSILLALQAVDRTRSSDGSVLPEAEEALHRAVVASRIVLRVPGLGGALDWSPDGSVFVTEGPEESGLIDIRDARTGESVRSFHGHDPDVNLVAFSHDGAMLATSGDDGTVRVWDPTNGEELWTFAGAGQVWGVSFSPDGSLLAAAWWDDAKVKVWDLATGRRVSEVGPLAASFTTSFSPDGRRLAIATFDSGGVVADVRSGEVVFTLDGQEFVGDVDWSPDGRWIATSSGDSTVRIWDARNGRSRFTLFGHRSEVVAADWSADSNRLVTGSNDGTVKVWEIDATGARQILSMPVQERGGGLWVAFSPDGDRVMTGDQGITAVKVFDVSRSGGAEWANVATEARDRGGVAFTADGTGVVVSNGDGSLSVWDAETGERSLTVGRGPGAAAADFFAVAVSPDGRLAATSGDVARVWDLATSEESFVAGSAGGVLDVAWNADGSLLATASRQGLLRIVDRSGREVAALRQPGFHLPSVAFGPGGRLVAVASEPAGRPNLDEARVRIWDWERQKVVRTIPTDGIALAFSPDGRQLATAPLFGPVAIWDTRSGRLDVRLTGHTGAVNAVAFAPDGSGVATASTDGTVRLWDPRTGRQELLLDGHDGMVADVAFSPDGSKLVSAGTDGIVRVWALDLGDLVAIAARSVTRALTAEECRQYLHTVGCS